MLHKKGPLPELMEGFLLTDCFNALKLSVKNLSEFSS
ncbi:hypothetical protein VTH8203_00727 [Vibrio thalassae]|uniref:Uncharacterized protein n=1 Tax=Vibrio thalassae TaxID=1243014 RepID=A0A240EF03_9VIBR|nr:hypothetical protein VTH8203_00727 [Vibrio thalassae]